MITSLNKDMHVSLSRLQASVPQVVRHLLLLGFSYLSTPWLFILVVKHGSRLQVAVVDLLRNLSKLDQVPNSIVR